MLISLLIHHPEALPSILAQTPTWVWGLLTALMALGVSQLFRRRAHFNRIAVLPIAMVGLSAYSLASALHASDHLASALAVWLLAAAFSAGAAMLWRNTPPNGTGFDSASRKFDLPGSPMPLLLILAIFLTKYGVGIELAMQPGLVQNTNFALGLAAVYGVFNGIFAARALRLWRLKRGARPPQRTEQVLSA